MKSWNTFLMKQIIMSSENIEKSFSVSLNVISFIKLIFRCFVSTSNSKMFSSCLHTLLVSTCGGHNDFLQAFVIQANVKRKTKRCSTYVCCVAQRSFLLFATIHHVTMPIDAWCWKLRRKFFIFCIKYKHKHIRYDNQINEIP